MRGRQMRAPKYDVGPRVIVHSEAHCPTCGWSIQDGNNPGTKYRSKVLAKSKQHTSDTGHNVDLTLTYFQRVTAV